MANFSDFFTSYLPSQIGVSSGDKYEVVGKSISKLKNSGRSPKITKLVGELCYHMYRLCARLEKILRKSATFDAYNSHISRCVITWITCGDVWVSGITHRNLLEIFSTVAHNLYM